AAFRHLCRSRGVSPASVEPVLYTHVDGDAVRHTFRVAASLDSMMIGEPQILGQVKDAFALAQACETIGPVLHTLFTQAFAVAKKVRGETEIARHAVSVSFAAVELAKKIFAGLRGRAVLLVGAGKMGERAARAAPVLHRYRGATRRRGEREHARRRVLLQHRRPQAGGRGEHPRAAPRGATRRGAGGARGGEVRRPAGRRRGHPDDRLAARAA